MVRTLVPVIAGQQWRLLMLLTAALTGAELHGARETERRAAQTEEAQVWVMQGPGNPHGAAHFRRYLFKLLS